jgi:hypothetical protein
LGALISSAVLVASSLVAVFNGTAAYKTAKGRSLNEKAINLHLQESLPSSSAT